MALYKNVKPISFTQGVNEAIDDKLIVADITKANNVIVNKAGNFETRKGFDKMPVSIYTSSEPLSTSEKLVSYGELMLFDESKLYSFSTKLNKWVSRADRSTFNVETQSFLRSSTGITKPRLALSPLTNIHCISFVESSERKAIIYSKDDAVRLTQKITLDTGTTDTFSFYKEGTFMVFYTTAANDLKVLLIPENNIENTATLTLSSDASADSIIRAIDFSDKWAAVMYKNMTGTLTMLYVDNKGVIGTLADKVQEKTDTGISIDTFEAIEAINVSYDYWVAYKEGANLKITKLDQAFNIVVTETLHSTGNLGLFTIGIVEGVVNTVFTTTDANSDFYNTYISLYDGVVNTSVLMRGVSCASNIFEQDKVLLAKGADFQKVLLIVDVGRKIAEGQLEYLTAEGHLPTLINIINNKLVSTTIAKVNRLLNTYYYSTGLNIHEIHKSKIPSALVYSNIMVCAGSLNFMYDTSNYVELGFISSPIAVGLTPSVGVGALSEGPYFYTALYMWEDSKGNIHRSAPAPIANITLTAGQNTVTVVVPTLRQTAKDNVVIEIYRSDVTGGASYKLAILPNNPAVDAISFTDIYPDTDVVGNEMVYTEGGILENSRPQGASYMVVHQDRLFIVPQSSRRTLQYSYVTSEGYPPEFSDYLTVSLPVSEDITAIHGLGDLLVVFTEHSVGIVSGQGADPTGAGASYQFSYVSQQVGCTSPDSLVETDTGLYFYSKKGLYVVNRGGGISFAGHKIQTSMDNVLTGQGAHGEQNVYFFSDTKSFIFNEVFGIWSTASLKAEQAISHNSDMYLVSEGVVWKSNNIYSDDGSFIKTTVKTGWIITSNFQRIYQALVYGKKIGNHKAVIRMFYDYEEDTYETLTFDSISNNVWGSFTWGSQGFDDEAEGGYVFSIKPRRQKCKSVSFEISAEGIDNAPTGGFGVSGVDLLIGSKKGIRKVGESKNARSTRT